MNQKIANPGALGLACFALTTFLLNLVNAEIIPAESLGIVLPMGLFYGGLVQVLAGMWDIKRGDIFGGTCFSSFGAFWIGLATMIILEGQGILPPIPPTGMAALLIAWGLFTLYATVATFKLSRALVVVFVSLVALFFLLAAGQFNHTVHVVGGYVGLFCALVAWYTSAAILINTVFKREVLPLGNLADTPSEEEKREELPGDRELLDAILEGFINKKGGKA